MGGSCSRGPAQGPARPPTRAAAAPPGTRDPGGGVDGAGGRGPAHGARSAPRRSWASAPRGAMPVRAPASYRPGAGCLHGACLAVGGPSALCSSRPASSAACARRPGILTSRRQGRGMCSPERARPDTHSLSPAGGGGGRRAGSCGAVQSPRASPGPARRAFGVGEMGSLPASHLRWASLDARNPAALSLLLGIPVARLTACKAPRRWNLLVPPDLGCWGVHTN